MPPDKSRFKQIQIYAPPELADRLILETKKQRRSMNNLIIVLLMRVFRLEDQRENEAGGNGQS